MVLNREEFVNHQTFSPSDLILGRLRIEGVLSNKLPHQILQISLNNGREYYDIDSDGKFVLKVKPQRSLSNPAETSGFTEVLYDVIHDGINFYYQKKGNQQI